MLYKINHINITRLFIIGLICCLTCGCGGGSGEEPEEESTPSDRMTISQPEPLADCGPDLSGVRTHHLNSPAPEEIVLLNPSGSTGSEWDWSVISKPASAGYRFTSPNTPISGFYADMNGEYTLQLTVSNSKGQSATDTLIVTLIDDMDYDGLEDVRDPDVDGDSVLNKDDLFPTDQASHGDFDHDGLSNYDEEDVDGDGISDIADDFPLTADRSQFNTYHEARETVASNQNDGISVSENAGSIPLTIHGTIKAADNRVDIDYFQVTFGSTGRYSVVLNGAAPQMAPAVAIINKSGLAVNSTSANMPLMPGSTAISIYITTAGTYYLTVTDSQGISHADWTYGVNIFADEDLDGVADDLEQALDSNYLTADSDGDSISDFVEVYDAIRNWPMAKDADGDHLPPWWDLDTDGDSLPDAIEYFTAAEVNNMTAEALAKQNDVDQDGFPNYMDTDSDGNGIDDSAEAGENPQAPRDTDGDAIPDFIDLDDDGDGLLDINESPTGRLTTLTPSDTAEATEAGTAISLITLYNATLDTETVARSGDSMIIEGYNLPDTTYATWIVISGQDGVVNLSPSAIDTQGLHFIWPDNFGNGLTEVFVVHDDEYTNSLEAMIPAAKAPILTGYTINSGTLVFDGYHLADNLTVYFTEASVTVDNSSGSDATLSVTPPDNAKSGEAYVSDSHGQSNTIWVNLSRPLVGTIVLPSGSSIDVSRLDVARSLNVDEESHPDANGDFTTTAAGNGPTLVTALIDDGAPETATYAVFLEALALPDDAMVTLNAAGTAVALVWDACGVQGLVRENDWDRARTLIQTQPEVIDWGHLLETQLATDAFALAKFDTELKRQSEAALIASANAIQTALTDGTLASASSDNGDRSNSARELAEAMVAPADVDGITVSTNSQGNVAVENTTRLYLSVKITGSDGNVLQKHLSGIPGQAGPQGNGGLSWKATTDYNQPRGKNCTVQVITPGNDTRYTPQTSADYTVHKYLLLRTVVEQVLWPSLSSTIAVNFSPRFLTGVLMAYTPDSPGIVAALAQGELDDGMSTLLNTLGQDFAGSPPGWLTQELSAKLGSGITEEVLQQLTAKIGAKLAPGMEQAALAYDIAGHITHGVNAAQTVDDLIQTDSVIEFKVKFPLRIDRVIPDKVTPNGKDKQLLIEGLGFSDIVEDVGMPTMRPYITFRDNQGNEVTREPDDTNAQGTQVTVTIPGWFLDEDTHGPIDITIHHPHTQTDAQVTLEDAVSLVQQVDISSILPGRGSVGSSATLYGAGFSTIVSDNQIMVGSTSALISSASETALTIVIPIGLTAGVYQIKTRSRIDGTWSDWSTSMAYEVVEGQVEITLTDNGSAKDDAFALYVDGVYRGTLHARYYDYTDVFVVSLTAGTHSAMLVGIEAADQVGTYEISFAGVENVTGDPTSGRDLVPGVKKYYVFKVEATIPSQEKRIEAFPYVPQVPDMERAFR